MAKTHAPVDRRPIASRDHRVWIAASRHLASAGVSANGISVAGMVCAILAGVAAVMTSHVADMGQRLLWLAVAAGAQLRLLANMLDGMVAIESHTASPVGELYNEVPDRVSDSAILIGLGYSMGGWIEMGFIAAILAVFTAYVRAACKVAGTPQDYCGPMAKPQRMFLITVVSLYLAMAPLSWSGRGTPYVGGLPGITLLVIAIGCLVTAGRRLMRGARALRSKRA